MKRFLFQFCLIGIVLVLISACDKNRIFDDYKSIPGTGWEKDSTVTFDFNIAKTTQKHNLYLNVRNKISYGYSNLWLFVEITEPDGKVKSDTFEITLSEPSGKWLGEGFGGLKTRENIYRRDVVFSKSGVYNIKIQQGMRENNLEGISDIGFRVEKSE